MSSLVFQGVMGRTIDAGGPAGSTIDVTLTGDVTVAADGVGNGSVLLVVAMSAERPVIGGVHPFLAADNAVRPRRPEYFDQPGNSYNPCDLGFSGVGGDAGFDSADGFFGNTLYGNMYWGLSAGDVVTVTYLNAATYRDVALLWYTGLGSSEGTSSVRTLAGNFAIDGVTPGAAFGTLDLTNTPSGSPPPSITVFPSSTEEILISVVCGGQGFLGPFFSPGPFPDPAAIISASDTFTQFGSGWTDTGIGGGYTEPISGDSFIYNLYRAPWTPSSPDLPSMVWNVPSRWEASYSPTAGAGAPYLPPPSALWVFDLIPGLFPTPVSRPLAFRNRLRAEK